MYRRQLWRFATVVLFSLAAACSEERVEEGTSNPLSVAAPVAAPQIPTARLPDSVVPRHYRLDLMIDPRQESFSGTAVIDIAVQSPQQRLWLNGKGLEVTDANITLADGSKQPLQWQQRSPVGVVELTTGAEIPAGEATLEFSYSATFNGNLEGLYRVRRGELDYAYTQFESTSARLAFPSFDQPGYKVPFDISLTVPEEHEAVTSTPQVSEVSDGQGNKTITFATTKPLPTYLVAFAVGPFDVVEWEAVPASDLRQQPIPLRGITTRGKGEQIHYALQYTAEILLEQEAYFDFAYPYAKLDIIAIPDFATGAMENAGAITYREQLILLDENSSVGDKRGYFYTHAHELAHQWFGNLVTPVWWDDLWLKESFATWNAYIILDRLYPEQNYLDSLLNGSAWVMKEDALSSARQIREPIERHDQIGAAFDGITYSKGGGVLAMFEAFLGPDNFRDGIRHYMKKYAWGNTTAGDFMAAIAEANSQVEADTLQQAFLSYIEQPGVPQLSVQLDCSGEGPQLNLSQQRYFPMGSQGDPDQRWVIPACVSMFMEGERQSQCFLADQQRQSVALEIEQCPGAILPNSRGTSYIRFAMPGEQWQSLLGEFDQLSTHEQIAIAGSLSSALNAGTITLQDYLAAVPVIAGSRSWRVSIAPRDDVYKLLDHGADEKQKASLQQLLKTWYQPQLDKLEAMEQLTPEQKQYRMFMLSTLALRARDQELLGDLTAMANAYTGFGTDEQLHPEALDANLTYVALLAAIDTQGKPFADLLWRHFNATDDATLREELLLALASSVEPEVSAEVREAVLSPDLAGNEIVYVYWGQMGRPANQRPLWEWTRDNLDAVLDRLPNWNKGRAPDMFSEFCNSEAANELNTVFTPIISDFDSGPRYLAKSLEKIQLCAAFIQHYQVKEGEAAI